MSRSKSTMRYSGFTLVEVLVIAPIAILVITGFVALMVTMVGDVIAGRARNVMTYDIQSALDMIEQDVRLTTHFLVSSGTMPSPQGKNGATSAFTSTNDLILGEIATDKNPIDPTRGFIYYDTPFSCGDPSEVYKNRIFFTTVIYFVEGGSLWRRTYVPTAGGTLCDAPWQVNTCAPGYLSTDTRCKTNDSEILRDIENFDVSYYLNPEDTVAISPATANTASSISVTIEGETIAAGRTVTATSTGRSTKLSDKDITLAPPASPDVSGSASGNEAVFTWPSVPDADSYIVRYNINGGGWTTASENTLETTFTIAANRGDTVSVKVFARNTTGASADIASNNASTAIPLWTDCNLQNGWVNYTDPGDPGYEDCGYTITKDGVVMFKGHIKDGSTSSNIGLFQLPVNLRPSHRLMFQMLINPNTSTRIDVNDDGWVRLPAGTNSTYLGLDGIYFIPRDTLYTWQDVSMLNGWTAFGSGFPTLQTTQDASGRAHVRGLLQQGTYSFGTAIAQLPSASNPGEYLHLPARGDSYNNMGIDQNGYIRARGISSSYYSTQAMYYPSGYGGWQSFSGSVGGNPNDNQLGNGWVAYGGIYPTPQYTKSDDGIVTIKGLIRNGSTADLTFMAKLPPGYRPMKTLAFSTVSSSGVARIDVGESGYLIFRSGSSGWMSLSNISYMAEQ